jgi:CspA family cold shock protein
MIGKVKWFDSKKGYGFILTEEGQEIFVHYTGIVAEGFRALTEGQNVEFEIGDNEKGRQAVNVTVVKR